MGWADRETTAEPSRKANRFYNQGERQDGKVIAEYIYLDQKREPYLKVERTETKQFPQWHWVRGGSLGLDGRWVIGKPKGPKIPYLLPFILKSAPEVPIFICEGEKDADTISNLELEATCASEGAGKWTVDLNKWFEGKKQVFILADNDGPGHKHALKVARNVAPIVAEVRIVRFTKLPNGEPMPEGGDVTDWVEAGGTKEQFLELCNSAKIYVGLPPIQVVVGEGARMQDEIEAALILAEQPVLVRAGILVQPIWSEFPTAKGGGKTKLTVLRPIVPSNLDYMLTKNGATFVRYDMKRKKNVPTDPPEKILRGLLERGHWGFPRVVGIINAPTMRPDGTILDQPGHDATTQLWLSPDTNLAVCVPPEPTKEEAAAALGRLNALLDGFPFVSDLDRSVALAALLTAVLRGGFDVAPMFLFLAHTAATGKSYLVNLISTLVHGRPCPVITASGNKEEMEKRLGALLLAAAPMISLDNLSENVEGDLLCQITEQPLVKVRILGKSETPECEWRGVMFGTGNNVTYAGDMTRRGLTCNLDAKVERPETRAFKFDPIERVLANRSGFIADALIIARAYFLDATKNINCDPLGSYGGWSRFVREPLIWLGQPDPVASMEEARVNDPERSAAVAFVGQWKAHLEIGKGLTVAQIIQCACETKEGVAFGLGREFEFVRPEFNSLLSEKCPLSRGQVDPMRLGKWLSNIRGQVHAGHRLDIAKKSSSHGHRWALYEVEGKVAEG